MIEKDLKLDPNNAEWQMAFDMVAFTNTSMFITGKAGTGKTTFIKYIQKEIMLILMDIIGQVQT